MKVLLYGYGNPGRSDDGLGVEFANRIETWVKEKGFSDYTFENNYQLNIEDAEMIADKDLVIFVDASKEDIDDFCISIVDQSTKVTFTTHEASPGYIVQLCDELFGKKPLTLLLHIKGQEWEFKEGLSKEAMENLDKAVEYFKIKLEKPGDLPGFLKGLTLC